MIVCRTKEVNSAGDYIRYNLQDINTGAMKSYTAQELKAVLQRQPNWVANLVYTKNGRIIDNVKMTKPRVIKAKENSKSVQTKYGVCKNVDLDHLEEYGVENNYAIGCICAGLPHVFQEQMFFCCCDSESC